MFTPRASLLALVSAAVSVAAAAPASLAADLTFSTKTWGANGLGGLGLRRVFVDGNNVYASAPLFISTFWKSSVLWVWVAPGGFSRAI